MLHLPFADMTTGAEGPLASPAAAGEAEGPGAIGDEVNAALIQVLPWGVSVVFHAALAMLALFAVWSTIAAPEEEIIVPLVRLSATPGAPLEMKELQKVDRERQERRTIQQVQRPQEQPMEQKVELKTSLIGVAGLTGAKSAPFNTTFDTGAQFKTDFFGAGGNARKIVFLVDATGTLLDSFPFVVKELIQTVNQLSDRQQYSIIFFNGDGVIEVPRVGWKPANAETKAHTIAWISDIRNVRVGGKANPLAALERALRLKPDLVFLLSDNITGQGKFLIEQDFLLREIKRLNASHTKINTIQFLYEDPIEKYGGTSTMQLIADQTGGIYRFVDSEELYLR